MRRLLPILLVCAGLLPAQDVRPSLPTSFYAEFDSSGPGASPSTREPYAKQLTPHQAAVCATIPFLGGWNPVAVQ